MVKNAIRHLVQMGLLAAVAGLLHYSLFALVGLYDQESFFLSAMMEYSIYLYVLIATVLIGVIYVFQYPYWKVPIYRSLAIVHGNIILYYYLTTTMDISQGIATILIGGSIVGFFLAYSRLKWRNYIIALLVIVMVGMAMVEIIPVYNKDVSLSIFLRQQPTTIGAISPTESDDTISVVTDTYERTYDFGSIQDEPLKITQDIKEIRYMAKEASLDNPLVVQLWNSDMLLIYPQTSVMLDQIKVYDDLYTSTNLVTLTTGNVSVVPHQSSAENPLSTILESIAVTYDDLPFTGASIDTGVQTVVDMYRETYVQDLRQYVDTFFGWDLSESPVLERLSYRKLLLNQFLDFQRYNENVMNYHRYRYLLFGDPLPARMQGDDVQYISLDKVEQTTVQERDLIDPIDPVQRGAEASLERTRFVKRLFE